MGCCLVVVCGINEGGKRVRIGWWLMVVCGVKGGGFRVACCLVVVCGVKGERGLSAALVEYSIPDVAPCTTEARKNLVSHHGLSLQSRYMLECYNCCMYIMDQGQLTMVE